MSTSKDNLEKYLAAARAARVRMNGYTDEQRAELDRRGRMVIQGGRRARPAVCSA